MRAASQETQGESDAQRGHDRLQLLPLLDYFVQRETIGLRCVFEDDDVPGRLLERLGGF